MNTPYRLGTSSKWLISVPKGLAKAVDDLCVDECRTRSDLVREALRRYIESARRNIAITASLQPPQAAE